MRTRGQDEAAGWMDRLRDHVNAVGVDEALSSLGKEGSTGDERPTQYQGGWDDMPDLAKGYLDRYGIIPVYDDAFDPSTRAISSMSPAYGGREEFHAGDFTPKDPTLKDKLKEAKNLPGLESSEDINVIMGRPVTQLTPDVVAKMDERFGKGKWIIKAYGDEAAAGYGIFFPQRVAQIQKDAQAEIWSAGENLSRYGFQLARDKEGKVVGIQHSGGDLYEFGSDKYDTAIYGDARYWADRASGAAAQEQGAMLPGGGKEFMAQPAFEAVGISDEERARGVTGAEGGKGEGRVHIVTRNGRAEIVPHSTWIKGDHLPVVFENDDTRAMAQAALDAINALPESERQGQIYAPDIMRSKDGYKVVEANPANSTGSSGYLGNNPFIIDAYVSHLTGREPAHTRFIRSLLTKKSAEPGKKAEAAAPPPKTESGGKPEAYWGSTDQPYWRPGANPTVDNVITRDNPKSGEREILLIQRGPKGAEAGKWALPGGFHDTVAKKGEAWKPGKETAEDAALRELAEETGLDASSLKGKLKAVGTYQGNKRDPRDNDEAWSSSSAFAVHLTPAQATAMEKVKGMDDASAAKWVPVSKLGEHQLAFDHGKIMKDAGVSGKTDAAKVPQTTSSKLAHAYKNIREYDYPDIERLVQESSALSKDELKRAMDKAGFFSDLRSKSEMLKQIKRTLSDFRSSHVTKVTAV